MIYWPNQPKDRALPEDTHIIPENLPIFMTGGWDCIFIRGTLNNYQYGLANHAVSDKGLIVGPWYHFDGTLGLDSVSDKSFIARWFDWKIKKIDDPFMIDFPVILYVMGEHKWRAEKSWPLPESRLESKYLFLSKKAPSIIDSDKHSQKNEENAYSLVEKTNSSDYSGENPILKHNPNCLHGITSKSSVKWLGGLAAANAQKKMITQGIEPEKTPYWEDERYDERGTLTFTTDPIDKDIEIIGPLALTFWAETIFYRKSIQNLIDGFVDFLKIILNVDEEKHSVPEMIDQKDVQWVIEISDVYPDGRSKNITAGWLSSQHRPYNPSEPTEIDPFYVPFDPYYDAADKHPNTIKEDKIYKYIVEIWPTDMVFKKGHRIRVNVSASDFPHLLPILRPSKNTIIIDEDHKARLDFKTTNTEDEGTTWKWINDSNKSSIPEEFEAANSYLMTHTDKPIENIESKTLSSTGSMNEKKEAESDTSFGDNGGSSCFIQTIFFDN